MTETRPDRTAPGRATLLRCFLRCYLVGAAFNTRGLQSVGLAFSMEPGVKAIYPDPEDRRRVWNRYLALYNTHPFWTPLLVGVFLSQEVKIAQGLLPSENLDDVRGAAAFTLSAIGDSFFNGSMMGVWALGAACLTALGRYELAATYASLLLVAAQLFKLSTFVIGYREGFTVLRRIKRWDLVNWGRRVKVANALLLALFWVLALPDPATARLAWTDLAAVAVLAAWAAWRPRLSRELVLLVLVLGGFYLAWIRV